jgi:hypothetical protein
MLTHLKDAYRNPVLHPEENYTDESILVLFGVCISAIVMMIVNIKTLASQTPELPFPTGFADQLAEYAAAGLPLLAASDTPEIAIEKESNGSKK